MAQEHKRGCGYRKVGGIYLVGVGLAMKCDSLPIGLTTCPTCGEGLKFSRNPREIDAFKMFGNHMVYPTDGSFDLGTLCPEDWCYVCRPPDDVPSYIMGVGERHYSPEDFIKEAGEFGVSKRIPAIPRNLVIGKSVVLLSHKRAIRKVDSEGKETFLHGIFYAFKPLRIEKLFWQSEESEEIKEDCEKRGITPVFIPDGDTDHAPGKTNGNNGNREELEGTAPLFRNIGEQIGLEV